jgi:very-short-patch-repair endonuclease
MLKERRRKLRRNQTDAEKMLWRQVRGKQLKGMKFFRQYSVGPYILDFYCPVLKLAVELDGGQHNDEENKIRDNARSAYLQQQGINVIRFWNHEVMQQLEAVLTKIAEQIEKQDEARVTPLSPLLP